MYIHTYIFFGQKQLTLLSRKFVMSSEENLPNLSNLQKYCSKKANMNADYLNNLNKNWDKDYRYYSNQHKDGSKF